MTMRDWIGGAAALLLGASPAAAQRLEGTVLLPGGTAPAAGVIVEAGSLSTVTRSDGSFALELGQLTPDSLRLLRTGHHPMVAVAQTRIVLRDSALSLPAKPPRKATTCDDGRSPGRDFAEALLGEAHKAMTAARFHIGRADVTARHVDIQHRTAKNGTDTLYTSMRRETGSLPMLFRDVSTEQLEETGFFANVSGERVYFAPHLGILLSPWFTETHCFTVSDGTPTEYIMEFEPTRERKGLVDVRGEYRFDRKSLELRSVMFHLVNLPKAERDANAGGAIHFARTLTGNWLAYDWNHRYPLLGYRQTGGTTTFVRTSMTLIDIIGHRTVGGGVTALMDGDRTLYRRDAVERPTSGSEFGQLCPERIASSRVAAARGTLVSPDSLGTGGVTVRATWDVLVVVDRTKMEHREHVRETVSDAGGRWVLCDLPVDRDVEFHWEIRGTPFVHAAKVTQPNSVVDVPAK